MSWAWLDDEDIYSECSKAAASEGGYFYFNELGKSVFRNAAWWAQKADSITSVYTFTVAKFSDITPGYAIRWLSKLAQRVAVTFPEVAAHFGGEAPQGKAIVTGYPVRQELLAAARDRGVARRALAEALKLRLEAPGEAVLPLLLV